MLGFDLWAENQEWQPAARVCRIQGFGTKDMTRPLSPMSESQLSKAEVAYCLRSLATPFTAEKSLYEIFRVACLPASIINLPC
jgi:hypothetical protein